MIAIAWLDLAGLGKPDLILPGFGGPDTRSLHVRPSPIQGIRSRLLLSYNLPTPCLLSPSIVSLLFHHLSRHVLSHSPLCTHNLHTSPALKRHAALWVHQDLILRLFTFTHRSYSTSLSLKAADRREGLKLRLGAPVTGCADDHSVSGCSLTADGNCALPYMRYWRPRNASHDAWKMPEILNDHGI